MRSVVPKTVPNPLGGPARREFKKLAAQLGGGGEGIFNTIDSDIMGIVEALSSIAEVRLSLSLLWWRFAMHMATHDFSPR